jgi:RNA polymerase sigma-54 factor
MALSAKLQARQTQALVMTPQLLQSIRLLQMTRHELDQFIEGELERNPLLEREDSGPAAGNDPPADVTETEDVTGFDTWSDGVIASSETMAETFDTAMDNVFPDDPGSRDAIAPDLLNAWKSATPGAAQGVAWDRLDLEDLTAAPLTLRGHVEEQIALTRFTPSERLVALEIADTLDDNGYVAVDMADVAARLGAEPDSIAAVLAILQGFDPPGIFARDLAECLALQLRRKDRFDPAMQALVANLELLARRDFPALKRICGVDEQDIVDMLAEIRALDPKPGAGFAASGAEPIVPDIIVSAAPDGSWAIDLNPAAMPRVLVNLSYHARVQPLARSEEDRAFLADCLQSANWLVRSLDQRARTIVTVMAELVRQQDAFLLHGVSHLRPLTLKAVADAISMHESTVSRVTANKYVMTPRGMFELRYFFTVSIASAEGGEAHSAEAVRHRIRELIEAEPPDGVLSDDTIVESLRSAGIDIARRTVAKYREAMNIASSVRRRREKQVLARLGA